MLDRREEKLVRILDENIRFDVTPKGGIDVVAVQQGRTWERYFGTSNDLTAVQYALTHNRGRNNLGNDGIFEKQARECAVGSQVDVYAFETSGERRFYPGGIWVERSANPIEGGK